MIGRNLQNRESPDEIERVDWYIELGQKKKGLLVVQEIRREKRRSKLKTNKKTRNDAQTSTSK